MPAGDSREEMLGGDSLRSGEVVNPHLGWPRQGRLGRVRGVAGSGIVGSALVVREGVEGSEGDGAVAGQRDLVVAGEVGERRLGKGRERGWSAAEAAQRRVRREAMGAQLRSLLGERKRRREQLLLGVGKRSRGGAGGLGGLLRGG